MGVGVGVCVGVCVGVSLDSLEVVSTRRFIYLYFGEVLRCPHKRIVTITKVYIARNDIDVEIIRFHTHSRL